MAIYSKNLSFFLNGTKTSLDCVCFESDGIIIVAVKALIPTSASDHFEEDVL